MQEKNWQLNLRNALQQMIDTELTSVPLVHIKDTPARVVRTFNEYIKNLNIDISTFFTSLFPLDAPSSLVIIKDIHINSLCAHHFFPFTGKAYFGYIPNKQLIGLSKVPRYIEVLAKRPTLQEYLTDEIINTFMKYAKPLGCGIVIEAVHTCMTARGVEAHGTSTRTIGLAGNFLTNPSVKQEFLDGINE